MKRFKNRVMFHMWLEHILMRRKFGYSILDRRQKWFTKGSIKGRIKVIACRNKRFWKQKRRKRIER